MGRVLNDGAGPQADVVAANRSLLRMSLIATNVIGQNAAAIAATEADYAEMSGPGRGRWKARRVTWRRTAPI